MNITDYNIPSNSTRSFATSMGLSTSLFNFLFSYSYFFDSFKLLALGSIIETGRRISRWLFDRFRIQYCVTAQFEEGDPAYEWIIHFLTQENVWRRSRDFRVTSKTSQRKWGVQIVPTSPGHADFVPTYDYPQLFRFKGYWVEIKRYKSEHSIRVDGIKNTLSTLYITMYTLDMTAMSDLVEEAHQRYIESSKRNIIIHSIDAPGRNFAWNNAKRKRRRPLASIILRPGMMESLVKDAREFLDTERWYADAGIPHRRGYLLFGPPGTGKTSTIYALAGELGMEIYSLSLASSSIDDMYLQHTVSKVPKMAILLIEDIDCAFPVREDEEPTPLTYPLTQIMQPQPRKCLITLSGLLNMIDGIGSEEGKLFFATTNYVDRLDPALLRPGRIDVKVQYDLATKQQIRALFMRFFPESLFERRSKADAPSSNSEKEGLPELNYDIPRLADTFAASMPENEFSTAELQGYLLTYKKDPQRAVEGVNAWIEEERKSRKELEERKENLKRAKMTKEMNRQAYVSSLAMASGGVGQVNGPQVPGAVGPSGVVQATPADVPNVPGSLPNGVVKDTDGISKPSVSDGGLNSSLVVKQDGGLVVESQGEARTS